MKKDELIAAAEDLNTLEFEKDIDIGLALPDLKEQVKLAALWLYATDEIKDETVEVLKQMDWKAADFKGLKEGQDPLPAFYRYAIVTEPDPTPQPEEKKKPKAKAKAKPKTQKKEKVPEEVPVPEEDSTDVEANAEETPPEHMEDPTKNKQRGHRVSDGPSAYATAIAMMGPDPELSYPDLIDAMKERGFDTIAKAGVIKTGRSILRTCYRVIKENGHIKDGH